MSMEESLEDYLKARLNQALNIKCPEEPDKYLSNASRVVEKKRQLVEVDCHLDFKKEEYERNKTQLNSRKEQLVRGRDELNYKKERFERFVQENKKKELRSAKKVADEKALQELKSRELEGLKQELDVIQHLIVRAEDQVTDYLPSYEYLQMVVDASNEFSTARDIIIRYETLRRAYRELIHKEDQRQQAINEKRTAMRRFIEEMNERIVRLNNNLSMLQTEYDAAFSKKLKLEATWSDIKNTAAAKTLQLGQMKIAISNIYRLVCRYMKMQPKEEDAKLQLLVVEQFITDWRKVARQVAAEERTLSSHIPPKT